MKITDPIAACLGHQLRRCSAMMSSDLVRTMRAVALKPAEATTLYVIAANPGQTQAVTGRILDVRRANLVPHIARLLRLGLIRRKPGRGNSMAVTATAAGRRCAARIGTLIAQHEAAFQGRLERAERAELLRLLLKLRGDDPLE
ncbi:MAG: hypothetical protein IT480_03980 [Gammaproteobacteria bacterium]|nr:hypothetical protein [Gammaproteobacteria bacterium]